ncbi:MAG: hypothetical protein D6690_06595 [Nitrospirae bacterium]|nr:MAG: hypothetical protein D6690_06595 [Nitrospirota bacterium]
MAKAVGIAYSQCLDSLRFLAEPSDERELPSIPHTERSESLRQESWQQVESLTGNSQEAIHRTRCPFTRPAWTALIFSFFNR